MPVGTNAGIDDPGVGTEAKEDILFRLKASTAPIDVLESDCDGSVD